MLSLNQLLEKAHGLHASDVHLVCGLPAKCRIDGAVTDLADEVLTAQDCELYARELAGNVYETMSAIGELDLAEGIWSASRRMAAETQPCWRNRLTRVRAMPGKGRAR